MALEKNLLFVVVLVLGLWVSQSWSRSLNEATATINEKHEMWMARYGRVYKNKAEKEKRSKIFSDNLEYIESFNKAGNRSYKLSINEFADRTNEEFQASRNGYKMLPNQKTTSQIPFRYENVTAPTSMDWRKKGAVTPVKNQGQCATMNEKHEMWMARNGRVYKDSAEKDKRFKIFKDNVEYIQSVNMVENRPY
ncbi:hypothetical protein LWI28_002519 [Acer negundo]|uniref:Cathepsin propeptide inhibitor domain-containing protein n=1 Tax=Acer negundo TaxID=4023 RepID=A0AAD5JFS1_ACENE|nr:hypothetical protein LWI28_002519 [Acer negundo]